MSSRGRSNQPPHPQRRIQRTQTAGNLGESIFDNEVVPSSLVEIAPILRVANEVESSNPSIELELFRLPLDLVFLQLLQILNFTRFIHFMNMLVICFKQNLILKRGMGIYKD